jgi:hypothetical protein
LSEADLVSMETCWGQDWDQDESATAVAELGTAAVPTHLQLFYGNPSHGEGSQVEIFETS